nr:MAG TPA: hypothetical protein [Caudoviricetes sp.]
MLNYVLHASFLIVAYKHLLRHIIVYCVQKVNFHIDISFLIHYNEDVPLKYTKEVRT